MDDKLKKLLKKLGFEEPGETVGLNVKLDLVLRDEDGNVKKELTDIPVEEVKK